MIAVRGFGLPCGAVVTYGQGTPGAARITPVLDYTGCFARGQPVTIDARAGLGGAPGVLIAGLQPYSLPLLGVTVLVGPFTSVVHGLSNPGGGANSGT